MTNSTQEYANIQTVTKSNAYSSKKVIQENDLLASNLRSQLSPAAAPIRSVAPVLPVAKSIKTAPLVVKAPVIKAPVKRIAMQVPETTKVFASKEIKVIKTAPLAVPVIQKPVEQKTETIVKEVKTEIQKELASMSPVNTNSGSNAISGSCSDAQSEVSRARNSASDTDKLFYYRRALRLCKSKPEYHVEIGRVYSSIGRREEAEFEFSRALEIDPDNRDAQDELTMLMLNNTY